MSRQPGAILLVEDDPQEVELTLRALRQNDVTNDVTVAHDGVEAIELLLGLSAHPLPALVLLDLKLPRVGGLQVLQRIRADERTRLLPVVVLTSSHEDADVVSSYRGGANSYVRKPVEFAAFRAVVHDLSRYWLAVNQPPPPPGGLR